MGKSHRHPAVASTPDKVAQAIEQPIYRCPNMAFFLFFSYPTTHTTTAEPRNSAGAEALAVARRPKVASREKTRPPPVSLIYKGALQLLGMRYG